MGTSSWRAIHATTQLEAEAMTCGRTDPERELAALRQFVAGIATNEQPQGVLGTSTPAHDRLLFEQLRREVPVFIGSGRAAKSLESAVCADPGFALRRSA